MFKSQVQVTLQNFDLNPKGSALHVRCLFQVRPLTYELALELSTRLPEILFNVHKRPMGDVRGLNYDLSVPRQTLTFTHTPGALAVGVIKSVDIHDVRIARGKKLGGDYEFRLLFDAKFVVNDKATASRLEYDYQGKDLFLSFTEEQARLKFGESEKPSGEFINDRARQGRAGLGVNRPRLGGG